MDDCELETFQGVQGYATAVRAYSPTPVQVRDTVVASEVQGIRGLVEPRFCHSYKGWVAKGA